MAGITCLWTESVTHESSMSWTTKWKTDAETDRKQFVGSGMSVPTDCDINTVWFSWRKVTKYIYSCDVCNYYLTPQTFSSILSSLPPSFQSWDVFFRNANAGAPPGAAYQSPLTAATSLLAPQLSSLVGAQPNVEKLVEDHLAVQSLIRAYQVHRHPHRGLLDPEHKT